MWDIGAHVAESVPRRVRRHRMGKLNDAQGVSSACAREPDERAKVSTSALAAVECVSGVFRIDAQACRLKARAAGLS